MNKRSFIQITALWFLCSVTAASASELPEFYRGVRAMGMGNAFTALSDDHDAVFYNPAGQALNGHSDVTISNPKIEISADDIAAITDLRQAATKFDAATLNRIFGKHIEGDFSIFPHLRLPGFTLGFLYDVKAHIVARNPVYPSIESSYTRDMGVVTGFGYETRGLTKRHFMRMGVTLKWLQRTGFATTLPLSAVVAGDRTAISKLVGGPDSGWGAGLGFQYELPMTRSNDFILGAAWQDIGDTTFGGRLTENRPPPIRNNLSLGFAMIQRLGTSIHTRSNLKFSFDLRHVYESGIDPRLRLHMGGELDLGFVSVRIGLNQDSLTAGFGLNLWVFDISAVTYGVENQALAFMDRERRYMLQISFGFDIMGSSKNTSRELDRKKHPRNYQ